VTPTLLLAAVILLGSENTTARLVHGAGFALLAVIYLLQRARRGHVLTAREGAARTRRMSAAGLVLTAVAGSALFSGALPGTSGHRVVLRDYIEPPFDVGQYPSPLAGYRKYTKPNVVKLWDQEIFRVNGLPSGDRHVRIATLDDYDASVWRASNKSGDGFQRVGSTIPPTTGGTRMQLEVTLGRYADVWLPTVGDTVGITFTGVNKDSHSDSFRYNLSTGTGVVPDRLTANDSYELTAVVPPAYKPKAGDGAGAAASIAGDLTAFAKGATAKWSVAASSSDPIAKLLSVASWMSEHGAYTDGEQGYESFLPGHSLKRLATFSNDAQPAGDDEQYSAELALIANQLGIGARVVLGAVPEPNGVVKGRDIHAWVEIAISGHGWVPIYSKTFVPDPSHKPKPPLPPKQTSNTTTIVPPPVGGRPPSSPLTADEIDVRTHPPVKAKPKGFSFHIPGFVTAVAKIAGIPLLAVLAICGSIISLKARRRRLRRARGPAHQRLAHGWREILDYLKDLGDEVPAGTRRQQAALLGRHDLRPLAAQADGHVFGPGDVTEDHAEQFWRRVDEARAGLRQQLNRAQRVRAALSLRSLLPGAAVFR
jgi:hypothetical protein